MSDADTTEPDPRPFIPTARGIVVSSLAEPSIPIDEVHSWLHLSSPRVRFLKSQPFRSHILDLGAGDGNMEVFRRWLEPRREDLKMYAVSLEVGSNFDAYDGYEISNFNETKPDFGGMIFDSIMTNHFVEHIDGGLAAFADWAVDRLHVGGRVYVEFPSIQALRAPPRQEIADLGLTVSCSNFFDDGTHQATINLDAVVRILREKGFFVEESGYWRNPMLENELLAFGRRDNDNYLATVGTWMKTYFCQYAVAVKVG